MMTDLSFRLDENERRDPLWRKIKDHYSSVLNDLHGKLEGEKNTEIETAVLRGRIKLIRDLLNLEKPV